VSEIPSFKRVAFSQENDGVSAAKGGEGISLQMRWWGWGFKSPKTPKKRRNFTNFGIFFYWITRFIDNSTAGKSYRERR